MSTKTYIKYGESTLKTFIVTYYDTTMFIQDNQSTNKSKLFYNDITGFGIIKCDFSIAKKYNDEQRIAWIQENSPTPIELIEESVNIGEVSFSLYVEKNSREIKIKSIKGDVSTIFNRRMIVNIIGLWS